MIVPQQDAMRHLAVSGRIALCVAAIVTLSCAGFTQSASVKAAGDLLAKGHTAEAMGMLRQIISTEPDNADARTTLGMALIESGEFEPAVSSLNQAIRLWGSRPGAAYALYLRAKAHTGLRQVQDAAADLQKAVTIEPNFAEAWSDLGESRKILLDGAGALAAFEKAVQFAPDDPVAQTRLGSELLNEGKPSEAVAHLEEAARLSPQNQSALYNLQRALVEDGRPEQAGTMRKTLEALLLEKDRDAQNAFAAIQLNDQGAALEKAGKLQEALEKYRQAVQLAPEHAGIRVNYAAALLHLGQWKLGVAELRQAAALDPDNLAIQRALQIVLAHPIPGAQ